MKTQFYVIFDKNGFVKATKTDAFTLDRGQYATEVLLDVPDEAFQPINVPRVQVTLPVEAIRRTFEATVTEEESGS